MKTVKVLPGQNLYDLAVEHYGHADGLKLLIQDNPTVITSVDDKLAFNTVLNIIQEPLNKDVVDYCIKNNMHPVTGDKYALVQWELLDVEDAINQVFVLPEGIFFSTPLGVGFIDSDSTVQYDGDDTDVNTWVHVTDLLILASTDAGLKVVNRAMTSGFTHTAGLPSINLIWVGVFGSLVVIGTVNGLATSPNVFIALPTFTNYLSGVEIRHGWSTSALLYLATDSGLITWNGTTFTTYDTGDGLASDDVIHVHHDGSRLWIVYANNGVSTWDGVNFIHHTSPISLPSNDMRCVATGLLGDTLMGMAVNSSIGRIARRDDLEWSIEQASNTGDMPALTVTALAVDGADNIYVGTTAGLYKYTRNSIL